MIAFYHLYAVKLFPIMGRTVLLQQTIYLLSFETVIIV